MDRVQFRGRKVERSFPVAINWDTDKVRNRDKDEQLSRGYGKGRILKRIDYQTIMCLAEVNLGIKMQEMESGQPHKEGTSEMSREDQVKSNAVHSAHTAMDNVKASHMSMIIQFR